MIEWSIKAATTSGCFDKVIISTDDSEIADVAISCGAEVPFMRPPQLADDQTATLPVITHCIDWFIQNGWSCQYLCCLYPTAPFVQISDMQRAYQLLLESRDGSVVFPVTSFPFPIQRAIYLDSEGYSVMFDPNSFECRSQDLVEAFHDTGQFYWATPETWKSITNVFQGMRPLVIPRWRVQDIDTPEDWERAELMHQLLAKLSK